METCTLQERARVHAALGDEHRLAMVEALLPSDRSPSELGALFGLGSNLLAHHLDVLEGAGIIERVVSSGDHRRRYVRVRPSALVGLVRVPSITADHILFVCSQNSARSQLAAALWNASSSTSAESAGMHPAVAVHPRAVATAARHGLDLSGAKPRGLSEVSLRPDLVVTVCDQAFEELSHCDAPLLHWSIADPTESGTRRAFESAFQAIRERVGALLPLVTPARIEDGKNA